MTESERSPVLDNTEDGRWEIAEEGETAYLAYTRGPAVLVLAHTSIPAALGGRGMAGRLTRHALEVARDAGLKVDPLCPFVIGWLDRHSEYQYLLHRAVGPSTEDPFWF